MADLREALATSHHASMEWRLYESHIDRIAASGRASALGVSLWKARYMDEASAYGDSLRMLRRVLARRYRSERPMLREKIVRQVLYEYIADKCPKCRGVGEVVFRQLRVQCKTCLGVTVRHYGDRERARLMDLSEMDARKLAGKLTWLADRVESEDRQVNAVLVFQLERGL